MNIGQDSGGATGYTKIRNCTDLGVSARDGKQMATPEPVFQLGKMVWLNTKNIRTQQRAVKLDNRRLSRFLLTETIGSSAYNLELQASLKIHLMFSVSLLELTGNTPTRNRYRAPHPQ